MGICCGKLGDFDPIAATQVYVAQHERETDPKLIALKAAELRAENAEKARVEGQAPVKPKGPKCSICQNYVGITINPWQRTRGDILAAEMSDDSDAEPDAGDVNVATGAVRRELRRAKQGKHGIELQPCKHVFCGACLAQSIYRNLNVRFDPSTYGTKLPPATAAVTGKKVEFPMGCPTCQIKPGEKMVEIGDMTARLVLGDGNMDEWSQARYMSTLDILNCPYKNCNEPFDLNDVAPAPVGASKLKGLVQCPRCRKSLCRDCKVVWHNKLTCDEYQALPPGERDPEDIVFAELAKKEKWRQCPKCKAMVELKYGCNHITCICKHHFCYTCGADFEHKNGKYRCTGGKGCKVFDEQNLLERP